MQNDFSYRPPTNPAQSAQTTAFSDLSYEGDEYYEDDSHSGLYGAFALIAIIGGVLAMLVMGG